MELRTRLHISSFRIVKRQKTPRNEKLRDTPARAPTDTAGQPRPWPSDMGSGGAVTTPKRTSFFSRILSRPRSKHSGSHTPTDELPTNDSKVVYAANSPAPTTPKAKSSGGRLAGLRQSFSASKPNVPRSRSFDAGIHRSPRADKAAASPPEDGRPLRRSSSLVRAGSRAVASVGNLVRAKRRSKEAPMSPDSVVTLPPDAGLSAEHGALSLPASCISGVKADTQPTASQPATPQPDEAARGAAGPTGASDQPSPSVLGDEVVRSAIEAALAADNDRRASIPDGADTPSPSPPIVRDISPDVHDVVSQFGGKGAFRLRQTNSQHPSAGRVSDFVAMFGGPPSNALQSPSASWKAARSPSAEASPVSVNESGGSAATPPTSGAKAGGGEPIDTVLHVRGGDSLKLSIRFNDAAPATPDATPAATADTKTCNAKTAAAKAPAKTAAKVAAPSKAAPAAAKTTAAAKPSVARTTSSKKLAKEKKKAGKTPPASPALAPTAPQLVDTAAVHELDWAAAVTPATPPGQARSVGGSLALERARSTGLASPPAAESTLRAGAKEFVSETAPTAASPPAAALSTTPRLELDLDMSVGRSAAALLAEARDFSTLVWPYAYTYLGDFEKRPGAAEIAEIASEMLDLIVDVNANADTPPTAREATVWSAQMDGIESLTRAAEKAESPHKATTDGAKAAVSAKASAKGGAKGGKAAEPAAKPPAHKAAATALPRTTSAKKLAKMKKAAKM